MKIEDLSLIGKKTLTQETAFTNSTRTLIEGADKSYSVIVYYNNRTYLYAVNEKQKGANYKTSTPGNMYDTFCGKARISYKICLDFVKQLNSERFKPKEKIKWNEK